jgi:hypothetical protein
LTPVLKTRAAALQAAALFLAAALAACGTRAPTPAAPAGPAASVAETTPAQPDPPRQAFVVPPPPRRLAAADLAGWTGAEVNRRFGQPRLLRREPPAEIWQFPGSACTLLVYLYPAGNGLSVQHADAVPRRAGTAVSSEDCIESLLRGTPSS